MMTEITLAEAQEKRDAARRHADAMGEAYEAAKVKTGRGYVSGTADLDQLEEAEARARRNWEAAQQLAARWEALVSDLLREQSEAARESETALQKERQRAAMVEVDATSADMRAALAAVVDGARQMEAVHARMVALQRLAPDCPALVGSTRAALDRLRVAMGAAFPAVLMPVRPTHPNAPRECPGRAFARDAEADLRRAGIVGAPMFNNRKEREDA